MNTLPNRAPVGPTGARGVAPAGIATLGALLLALGAAVGETPDVAPPLMVLIAGGLWFALRGRSAWWDMFVLVLAGLYLLDYGFSNIGLPGGIPIPIVDLIGVALLARAATQPRFRLPHSLPFLLGTAYATLVAFRLLVDVPRFGIAAMRDATLAIEVSFLFIGYWAVCEYGLQRFVRMLSALFIAGLLFWLLYPARHAISDASPMVGIQRPVPLFGTFTSGQVVVAAFFFFALVRPYGTRSYVLAAVALPLMALMQSRGLYLAVPAAIFVIWVLGRSNTGARARRGLATALAVGAVALVVLIPFAPEGRVGKVSPSFVIAQLGTLAGQQGPGSPVDQRKEWVAKTLQTVGEAPAGWLVGVGLGPDLAFGFKNEKGVSVRKPHNDYLEAYARLGLLGFAFLTGMLGVAFVRIVQGARHAEGLAGRFLWFAVAQTLVMAVIAATQPLLAFPYGTVPLFVVLGAALAVCEHPRTGRLP